MLPFPMPKQVRIYQLLSFCSGWTITVELQYAWSEQLHGGHTLQSCCHSNIAPCIHSFSLFAADARLVNQVLYFLFFLYIFFKCCKAGGYRVYHGVVKHMYIIYKPLVSSPEFETSLVHFSTLSLLCQAPKCKIDHKIDWCDKLLN